MEWGALLLAIVSLIGALLDHRNATAPARRRKELADDYTDDVARVAGAVRDKDADALTEMFERERRTGIRDHGVDPRGPGDDAGLREQGADRDHGGPADRPST